VEPELVREPALETALPLPAHLLQAPQLQEMQSLQEDQHIVD
jgi:hypothetical protein